MARGTRKTAALANAPRAAQHERLASFEPFKGMQVNTIADLARLMEEFGIYRIYLRGPNSRHISTDTREAESGKWEVGVKLNTFIIDYHRSGACDSLEAALELALGVKTCEAQPAPEPPATAPDDDGLLV